MSPTPREKTEACPGCGAELPVEGGPTHAYMESSPACWARAGELAVREFGSPAYGRVRQLSVDTYAGSIRPRWPGA